MAKKTEILLIDDLDGSEAAGTVKFGLDGDAYEIELSVEHQKELRAALEKFKEAGTRLGRYYVGDARRSLRSTPVPRTTDPDQNRAIREWAEQQGMKVSPRGRISQAIVDAFNEAHPS
jgi:hypothetical protein